MNVRPIHIFCLLLLMSSCKSLQSLSLKDNSRSATASTNKKLTFLNDISITPGEQKNSGYAYNKTVASGNRKSINNISATSFNIEKADWLQVKYAIMLNISVEDLNNLQLLQQVDHWWGTRYCMGGSTENCIDCSAFTQTMLRNVYGVDVPRTAHEQYDFARHINDEELKEGDLVFFKTGRNISHVGLYISNYKFVHASTGNGVTISDLNDDYWNKKYAGAGRVISFLNPSP